MDDLRLDFKTIAGVVGLLILVLGSVWFFRNQNQNDGLEAAPTRLATEITPTAHRSDPTPLGEATPTERTYEIVTLLPFDAIPAIDNPEFYGAAEADAEYDLDELVLGVTINGESKAYSSSHLDRHEIVNDTLGGRKIAVTW